MFLTAADTETDDGKTGPAPSPDRKPVTDRTTKEQATEEWTQKRDDLLKNKSGIRLPSDLKTGDITVTKAMKSLESLANKKADDTDSEEDIAPEVALFVFMHRRGSCAVRCCSSRRPQRS